MWKVHLPDSCHHPDSCTPVADQTIRLKIVIQVRHLPSGGAGLFLLRGRFPARETSPPYGLCLSCQVIRQAIAFGSRAKKSGVKI